MVQEIKDVLLTLPEVKPYEEVKKRECSKTPDIECLKSQQKEAFDKLIDFLITPIPGDSHKGRLITLGGYAGTGKTFLLSRVVEQYLAINKFSSVAMTAPTNKAVKVAKDSAEYADHRISYLTCHKCLGLKEKIDDYGQQTFIRDFQFPAKIEFYKVMIVDEVSMLSDELFDMLMPFVKQGLKIIFTGDPAQIPPVGKKDCIPLSKEGREKYDIPLVLLTDIQRQSLDSPINEVAFEVRKRLNADTSLPLRETKLDDKGDGRVFINPVEDAHNLLFDEICKLYFNSANFKQDADFFKIIAWRNKTVQACNASIRRMIFGENIAKLCVGEKLIANAPIIQGEVIVFTTNDEFEVKSFTIETEVINEGQYNLKYYLTELKSFDEDNVETNEHIKIIHEDSEKAYKELMELIRVAALSHPKGSFMAKSAWEQFYTMKERFADVTYNYAITGHKSQGSTYMNAAVFEGDINMNRNIVERNRIKYTSFSRPKHKLFIIK